MYKSPIQIIQNQTHVHMEGEVLKAVVECGINVDKEELLKALSYDREQYRKGYEDGSKNALQWIPCSERLPIEELEKERSERGENAIYPVMVTAKVFSYEENKKIIIVKKAFYMEHEGRLFFSDTDCNEV